MNHPTILLLLLAVLHLLYGAGWWAGGWLLSLSRTAAWHWLGFCWTVSAGLLLFVDDLGLPPGLLHPLRDGALIVACMLARRGVARFMMRPVHDAEHLWLLTAFGFSCLALGSGPEALAPRTALVSALMAWVLLRLAAEEQHAIGSEFGRARGWVLALPPLLVGLALAARAALAIASASPAAALPLDASTEFNTLLLFGVVVVSTLFQFTLLGAVMLQLVTKLRHLSRHDPLTGLLNRRAWAQALTLERLQLRRRPRPLGLLMVDIVHFKMLNDRLGHAAGDAALCAVAATLQSVARATDVVARLGGEEFGMLLTDTDVQGVALAAKRVRAAIARLPFTHEDRELPMTVSVGAAVLTAEAASRVEADTLLALADRALYRAKGAGRNRVVIEAPPGESAIRVV